MLKTYLIVAGPPDEKKEFALYSWSGDINSTPVLQKELNDIDDFSPEVLIVFKDAGKMLLVSDDGSLAVKVANAQDCMADMLRKDGTCLNKYLTDPNKRTFRASWLEMPTGSAP